MSSWTSYRRLVTACIAVLLTLAALYPSSLAVDDLTRPFAPSTLRAVACPPLALVAKERGRHLNSIGVAAAIAGVPAVLNCVDSLRSRLHRSRERVPATVAIVRPSAPRAPPALVHSFLG